MGSGASAVANNSSRKGEAEKPGDDYEDTDAKVPEVSDSRSLVWRRAWRALLDYKWAEDEAEYEIHPEDEVRDKVQKALNEKLLEAQSAQGFIAGRCLVHLAADRGARKSLEALLDSGCQIDLRDKYGDTPLHVACKSGRESIVELLLEIGADPLLENKHGKTPFQWATDFGQLDIAAIVKRAGGDPVMDEGLPPEVPAKLADELMLSIEQVNAYREAFRLFDEDGSGELNSSELGLVIRSIGFQVSETEVIDMVNESDDDGSGALNFFEFLELMSRRFGEENPELTDTEIAKEHQALKNALGEFDYDKSGTLSEGEFMNAMMNYGEALTDSQAAEILTNLDLADSTDGENGEVLIDYDKLASALASR